MELHELQHAHKQWAERNFPGTLPYQPLLGILEEAGELAHAHLKGEQGIRHLPHEIDAMKVDAVGDIVIYLLHYCTVNEIDLEAAIETTWENIVSKRDWLSDRLFATLPNTLGGGLG